MDKYFPFPFYTATRLRYTMRPFKMNEAHILKIAGELKIQPRQVLSTAKMFAEGATVPFIARYRKEATGSLDEVAVTEHPRAAHRPRRFGQSP
jgi:hypothetical protein